MIDFARANVLISLTGIIKVASYSNVFFSSEYLEVHQTELDKLMSLMKDMKRNSRLVRNSNLHSSYTFNGEDGSVYNMHGCKFCSKGKKLLYIVNIKVYPLKWV